jgi:hypothetical protein
MRAAAVSALREAIAAVGIADAPPTADSGADLVVRQPDGTSWALQVKATAVPSWEWASKLSDEANHTIVVADKISTAVRQQLSDNGIAWFDRRGHLRLVGGGFFIDADVPPTPRPEATQSDLPAITGRSGLAAAAALLMQPDDPPTVAEISRLANLNASSISRALASLEKAQLAERLGRGRYRPLATELFWELADVWPRHRTPTGLGLSDLTRPELGVATDHLESVGWAAAGERAGVAWGAPLVLTGDYPTFFYVPDEQAIRTAAALQPAVERPNSEPAIALAVDPTGLIVSNRHRPPNGGLPVAHPLFCALDLSATSRDREALDQWDPPEEFTRVW